MSFPLASSHSSFFVEEISINDLFVQSVICPSPVEIFSTEITRYWHQYTVKAADASAIDLDGQCALLIDSDSSIEQIAGIKAVVVSFDEKKLLQHLKKRYGKQYVSIPWQAVIKDRLLLNSLVLWLIQQYKSLNAQNHCESWEPIESALLDLIIDNLERRQSTRPEDYEIKRDWFSELEAWMDRNLNNTISLDDLASVAGVSVRSIQKAFRQYRQCTPMDALMQKRLDKARKMLTSPTESTTVIEVSMELGYLHPSRFAKHYKNKFGENPSETLAKSRERQTKK